MTEENKTAPGAPEGSQASSSSGATLTVVGGVVSAVAAVAGAAAGAGWPGVVALALVGLSLPLGLSWLVNRFNGWSDNRDQVRAGSDAGNTAVDLANQGQQVSSGLDSSQAANPPTEGLPK